MKKEEVKALLEKTMPSKKAVCLSKKIIKEKLYTEWAILDATIKGTDALICMADDSIYLVKYTAAYMLEKLAKLH